ncbi:MAG: RNA-binding transcriptional accessory protein [Bacteroidales bacterium]|nr:RNA-binding transcriptional accessory protein [Bacteroidales bacterium]
MNYITKISQILNIGIHQVAKTIELLESGATVPFIARYRKEATGSLDEVQILAIRDHLNRMKELDKRRDVILQSICEQGKLTPELEKKIMDAEIMSELEDLYLPYKPKRKTRATVAISKGLEPLAHKLFQQNQFDVEAESAKYVSDEKEVHSEAEALAGARDIIAEWVNEDATARNRMRNLYKRTAFLSSKVAKNKEEEGEKYQSWFDWNEPAMKAPSHRILAMLRGEEEGFLKIKVEPENNEAAIETLEKTFIKGHNDASKQVKTAIADSYKRLLSPSMETEILGILKEKADAEAINVFTENLRQLLLASPLGQKTVLAIDPGFRTGCKVVCLDKQGQLLHNETIYPFTSTVVESEAIKKVEHLVEAYKIEAIAIGNGTAGRETEAFVRRAYFKNTPIIVMVNESGASIYSASDVARREFPNYDVTVRGAVSIGRRLMDPLSELVKIDPKSIGVGQYQHDVNQPKLQEALTDTVVSCVNNVGVELNTASKELLTYVSGIGPTIAQNIVDYRNENGEFESRVQLKKVPRLGEKVFELCAGFLRIRNAKNPLDQSAVHPERYKLVEQMARHANCSVPELLEQKEYRDKINIREFITPDCGLPTLQDIMKELEKPGRDPRTKFEVFEFNKNINKIEDLVAGMILPGIVTNITAFGAFVDIGVHQDGLVHVSQMADRFVSNPNEVVRLQQNVLVRVLDVDISRRRINLSMRNCKTQ